MTFPLGPASCANDSTVLIQPGPLSVGCWVDIGGLRLQFAFTDYKFADSQVFLKHGFRVCGRMGVRFDGDRLGGAADVGNY